MEELDKLLEDWNGFIKSLEEARQFWERIKNCLAENSRTFLDDAPAMTQKLLSVYGKTEFNVMIPRFVDFYRAQGGLDAMLVEIKKEEEEEKQEVTYKTKKK